MRREGAFANNNADLAGATRRDFLVRAGASVGMLAAATSLAAPTPAKASAKGTVRLGPLKKRG